MNKKYLGLIKPGVTYALVPARAGSKGVPGKNIRCVQGYPLMAYSIAVGVLCPGVSRVIVSTDSAEYAEIARHYGAETPFLRPAEISGDLSPDIEFVQHAIDWLANNEGELPEYIMHLRPTYPLRDLRIVAGALDVIKADVDATCLRSAHSFPDTPLKWFKMDDQGRFVCLFDGMTPDQANEPRQSFPDTYVPDGYVDVLRTSFIIKSGLLHGDRVAGYVVPEGIDIDCLDDYGSVLELAETTKFEALCYLREKFQPMKDVEW